MENYDELDFGTKSNSMDLPTKASEGKEGTKKQSLVENKMDFSQEPISSSPKKLGGKSKDGTKSSKTLGVGTSKKTSGSKKRAALKQA